MNNLKSLIENLLLEFDALAKGKKVINKEVDEDEAPGIGDDAPTGGAIGAMGGDTPPAAAGTYSPGTAPTMPESFKNKGKIMENVDKDVAAMIASLKKYDKLKESVAPVLMARPLAEKKGGKPEWLEDAEKKAEKKEGKMDGKKEEVKEAKECKACHCAPCECDDKKDDVMEGVDADVLNWMKRFAKLGNMKGYGR